MHMYFEFIKYFSNFFIYNRFLISLFFIRYLLTSGYSEYINKLSPSYDVSIQTKSIEQLILRVVGDKKIADQFQINVTGEIQNNNYFQLTSKYGKLQIIGSTGVDVACGLYYYLKKYCHVHISWGGQQVLIPSQLPVLKKTKLIQLNDRLRYFGNVCTASYSTVWWGWTKWEPFIDWLALSGINAPLAFTGQEAIWRRVYLNMGFKQKELDSHFSGPAFLAWQRMGNIRGFGGPLSLNWHKRQVNLQHKILSRMRSLGMIPVLPAFAGHVPSAFILHYPGHNVSHLRNWNNFNSTYCCTLLLNPQDLMFKQIGKAFLTEYIKEFGTDHMYSADTFNEMQPFSSSPEYIREVGQGIFESMISADQSAIWVMQAWIFEDSDFWKPPQAKALLLSVPIGRLLVLDLFSELHPYYKRYDNYYGQPYIWCMLHNFGGNLDMYGAIQAINENILVARNSPNSTMVGLGLTMEGIFQNDFIYEFMLENIWTKKERNVNEWSCNYSLRRYGFDSYKLCKAWILLSSSIYNCTTKYINHGKDTLLVQRPSFVHNVKLWYSPDDMFNVWDHFISITSTVLTDSPLFRYDLVDITRQCLMIVFPTYLDIFHTSYKKRNLKELRINAGKILTLISDIENLLSSDVHFLLGNFLNEASLAAKEFHDHSKSNVTNLDNSKDAILYEWNSRNQITIWGPKANIIDYANKQWGGLVKDYYYKRWELFIEMVIESIEQGKYFNTKIFNEKVFNKIELAFTLANDKYTTKTKGDSVSIARLLHKKYRPNKKYF